MRKIVEKLGFSIAIAAFIPTAVIAYLIKYMVGYTGSITEIQLLLLAIQIFAAFLWVKYREVIL